MSEPTYHRDIAVAHFAELLRARAKSKSPYRALCLLQFLWGCVDDAWKREPTVCVAMSRMEPIISDRSHCSRTMRKLIDVGAVKKGHHTRGGTAYTLLRPDLADLSSELREQAEATPAPGDYRHRPKWRVAEDRDRERDPVDVAAKRAQAKKAATTRKERAKLEREFLRANALTRSMIRDGLAWMTHQPKSSMRYSGPGSTATRSMLRWLMTDCEPPPGLVLIKYIAALSKAVRHDKKRPQGAEYIFEQDTEDKRAYLARVIELTQARLDAEAKAAAAANEDPGVVKMAGTK